MKIFSYLLRIFNFIYIFEINVRNLNIILSTFRKPGQVLLFHQYEMVFHFVGIGWDEGLERQASSFYDPQENGYLQQISCHKCRAQNSDSQPLECWLRCSNITLSNINLAGSIAIWANTFFAIFLSFLSLNNGNNIGSRLNHEHWTCIVESNEEWD